MSNLPISPPSGGLVTSAGRVAHDVGAAALLGGNLFARVAMHPALRRVSEPTERGRVTNDAWRRYGTVNGAALAAVIGGWLLARSDEGGSGDPLALARDVAVVAVTVTGVASAIEGVRFNASEPDGAVSLKDGNVATQEAKPRERRMKRVLRVLGAASLAADLALVGLDAALAARASTQRPPLRRILPGR